MKKLFLSTLLLLSGFSSFAQKENFEIVNNAVPANYELVKNENAAFIINNVLYYRLNKSFVPNNR